jgi:hypothetical protein
MPTPLESDHLSTGPETMRSSRKSPRHSGWTCWMQPAGLNVLEKGCSGRSSRFEFAAHGPPRPSKLMISPVALSRRGRSICGCASASGEIAVRAAQARMAVVGLTPDKFSGVVKLRTSRLDQRKAMRAVFAGGNGQGGAKVGMSASAWPTRPPASPRWVATAT